MNSASIKYIAELSFIEKIIIPPSPGDSGASIGAAYYAFLKSNNKNKRILKPSLFHSKSISIQQGNIVTKILNEKYLTLTTNFKESIRLCAELISNGEIIGVVIDNAETGPRALGNRSLICNGTDDRAVKILNTVIKDRSPFRPTAPAVTYETAKKYFVLNNALQIVISQWVQLVIV